MKLANLPKKIPIGATKDTRSLYINGSWLYFLAKKILVIIMPNKPPWKDIPPCQILKISKILFM